MLSGRARAQVVVLLVVVAACGHNTATTFTTTTPPTPTEGTTTTSGQPVVTSSTVGVTTTGSAPEGTEYTDIAYGPADPGNRLDLHIPDVAGGSLLPLILWHSGSGWLQNDVKDRVDERAAVLDELTARGFAVATVNIRSSSDARFPAQGFDIRAAIRYLRENAATYHIDPGRIAIMGDSSGGWAAAFAAMTSDVLELEGEMGVDGTSSAVKVAVAFFPPTDFLSIDAFASENDLPTGVFYPFNRPTSAVGLLIHCPDEGPEVGPPDRGALLSIQACPDETERADPAGYVGGAEAPIWLLHGLTDDNVPFNQSQLLYAATTAAGNEARLTLVPAAGHSISAIIGSVEATTWITRRGEDEEETIGPGPTWDDIVEFVRAHL